MISTWMGISIILVFSGLMFFLFKVILNNILHTQKKSYKVLGVAFILFVIHVCVWVYLRNNIKIHSNLEIYFIFTISILATYVLIDLFNFLFIEYYLSKKKKVYIPPLVHRVIFIAIFFLAVVFLLRFILNFNPFALVTVSAVITAVLGFALQDTFGSFFAGLNLGRVLRIGDWVCIGDIEGMIIKTDWVRIQLRNWKGDCIVIPNSVVSKQIFVNYSMPEKKHACYIEVGTSYQDPPNKVKNILIDIALGTKGVLKDPYPCVRLMGYGDFSINYRLVVWIEDYSYRGEIKNEIYTKIWYQLKRNNVTIPFPIRTVLMSTEDKEERKREEEERINRLIEILKKVDFLNALSDQDLLKLVSYLKIRTYGKGEIVIKKGEKGESLYVIESGKVEVSVIHKGERKVLAQLGESDFFGEMSLLTGERRSADVTTLEDTIFLEICKKDFAFILSREPKLAEEMSKILVKREMMTKEELTKEMGKHKKEDEVEKASNKFLRRIKRFFTIS
ncbi:MAG: mechanosensitive ion channel family protein [bacterium]|nr:mechanosensitive ion channel family protein [bacterium]